MNKPNLKKITTNVTAGALTVAVPFAIAGSKIADKSRDVRDNYRENKLFIEEQRVIRAERKAAEANNSSAT
jgi:hypothetical protein